MGNGAGFDGEEKVFWCCVCAEVEVVAGAGGAGEADGGEAFTG